ncbi:MAG: hypothetical protein IH905_04545 [Proteobacteria bacterium]|nr:hypothetical protein [Pseudomonadota bacterium]
MISGFNHQISHFGFLTKFARESALADPEGKGLAKVLSEFGAGGVGAASPS